MRGGGYKTAEKTSFKKTIKTMKPPADKHLREWDKRTKCDGKQ